MSVQANMRLENENKLGRRMTERLVRESREVSRSCRLGHQLYTKHACSMIRRENELAVRFPLAFLMLLFRTWQPLGPKRAK